MVQDDILTFRAPAREPGRVEAAPSAVLEMAYAAYTVTRRGVPPAEGATNPGWLRRLARESPEPLRAVARFWADRAVEGPGVEAFVLGTRFGYARDDEPDRFLADLPVLAERFLSEDCAETATDDPERMADFRLRLARLRDAETARAWVAAHRGLWRLIAPIWEHEGRAAAQAAADTFLEAYRASGSVLAALPPHHFVQFEAAAASIRKAEADGRVHVVPLGLAVAGGFHFDAADTLYIGFGLQVEDVHARTAQRVAELAGRMKVFADPTRAMLLALIGRFSSVPVTVGDLAQQLGVSQPTVSGHLRLLREAGLVSHERRGNKAFHRLDADAVRALLADFATSLVEGNGGTDGDTSA
jgi:ArsR family transcriptional regulator, arsenate/arsenite/antimonite-responsive transcriptional repressor